MGYPTDSPDALKFKAEDSKAAFIVLGKAKDLSIYSKFIGELETVKGVIFWNANKQHPETLPADAVELIGKKRFFPWDAFMEEGNKGGDAKSHREEVQKRIAEQMPGQACSVVYTSGTTGTPKGVMLSQDSMASSARTISEQILTKPPGGWFSGLYEKDEQFRILSFLPLNHVAGQMMDIIGPLFITSQKKGRYATVTFPAKCYLKKTCSIEMLTDTRPVIFLGVPEVWDGLKLKLERAATGVVAKVLPWSAILWKIGLDKVMYAVSGAGPIKPDTISFFKNIGIDILNMFAQSESSALGTTWTNEDFKREGIEKKFGSIGRAVGNELKLDDTKDDEDKSRDEIMLKGRNVMLGYLNRPDKTKETVNQDGWLMTGDKGSIDEDGFVYLTGRLKEIMKIQGEMIAPVAVEQGILKSCNPPGDTILKQVIVVGDGMYYISVLITLLEKVKEDENGTPRPTGDLDGAAKKIDPALENQTVAEAKKSKKWAAHLSECIGAYNKVAAKSQEAVYRYVILPKDITAEDSPDLMTPTFKIKREGVSEQYQKEIEQCGGENPLTEAKIMPCPDP